jgi:hypothetical protein
MPAAAIPSSNKASDVLEGGHSVATDPCGAFSEHGYAGTARAAVEDIAQFINKPSDEFRSQQNGSASRSRMARPAGEDDHRRGRLHVGHTRRRRRRDVGHAAFLNEKRPDAGARIRARSASMKRACPQSADSPALILTRKSATVKPRAERERAPKGCWYMCSVPL